MAFVVRRSNYYYVTVKDQPGEAYRLLSRLARQGVNLLAFTGVPTGPDRTQFSLFPEDGAQLTTAADQMGMALDGPHPALLVTGDDELGALVGVHQSLFEAGVNVYASNGVADGRGCFGYVLYVQPHQFEQAVEALRI